MSEDKRRLAAILCADVVGYSRLMGADEEGTVATLEASRTIFRTHVGSGRGRVVDTAGDSVLAIFDSPVEAVRCAIAVQADLERDNTERDDEARMLFRIGINLGDVIEKADGTIYGNGVNVAARLQGLALPGGIMISEPTHDTVATQIAETFAFVGEKTVKNIAEPVRSYALGGIASTDDHPRSTTDKPSIAILPFNNLSRDEEQVYFADGMTEDIITELSRFAELAVIARNSAFTYKGQTVKAQLVAEDLGARYVVEGSVRKAGNRVRVSAQLIDAESDAQIWADKYDRDLDDIFALQDELTQAIVATLPGRIGDAELNRVKRKPPGDMAALDYLHAGRLHHHGLTKDDNDTAVRMLDKAIDLDPDFAQAYAWKACVLGQRASFGFSDTDGDAVLEQAFAALNQALSLDANDVECHRLLCEVHIYEGDLDKAAVHNERALSLNPNDPRLVAQKGELLTWQGHPADGAAWIEQAIQLDPYGAPRRMHLLGRARYGQGRYEEAAEAYRKIAVPRQGQRAELAASLARLEQMDEAKRVAADVLEDVPDFTISGYLASLSFGDSTSRDHLGDGMRTAGLPD